MLSYNEEQQRQAELRHLFVPTWYGFTAEAIIAAIALVIFNLSTLNDEFINKDSGAIANPLSLWSHLLNNVLDSLQQVAGVQHVLLFFLWASVGALFYILVFRFIQVFISTRSTVSQGVRLVQAEHTQGALRWFASLHDFFLKALVVIGGTVALAVGILVCFGIASQELNYGLINPFPSNVLALLLSLIAAFLSVRVVVIGISLLSRRFRIWYNS